MPLKKSASSLIHAGPHTLSAVLLLLVFSFRLTAAESELSYSYPVLNTEQSNWIGQQIFRNECNLQINCLTSWNAGEEFPSLGIGHFIWYQAGQREIFEESFPALLRFLQSANIEIPSWIIAADYNSPWTDREGFLADSDNTELSELRTLLASTIPLQTAFIIQRFESSLNEILAASAENERSRIRNNFFAVANSQPPYGMYALIDYVNFKGEGNSPSERYAGQGWGLLQVLAAMPQTDTAALENFITAAREVLQTRVTNAPPERNETRWLEGWFKRVDTYLPPPAPPIQ